jgi:hypothetical protein
VTNKHALALAKGMNNSYELIRFARTRGMHGQKNTPLPHQAPSK